MIGQYRLVALFGPYKCLLLRRFRVNRGQTMREIDISLPLAFRAEPEFGAGVLLALVSIPNAIIASC
jgi:hypothetical protein